MTSVGTVNPTLMAHRHEPRINSAAPNAMSAAAAAHPAHSAISHAVSAVTRWARANASPAAPIHAISPRVGGRYGSSPSLTGYTGTA